MRILNMKRVLVLSLTVACASGAFADVYSTSLNGGSSITVLDSSQTFNFASWSSTDALRGWYVSGNWTAGGGDPWSTEFQTSLLGSFEGSGGVTNGNPYNFGSSTSGIPSAPFQFGDQYDNGNTNT